MLLQGNAKRVIFQIVLGSLINSDLSREEPRQPCADMASGPDYS